MYDSYCESKLGEIREMIDFETELKKFHPSLEVSEVEDAVDNHDLADMIDLIVKTVQEGENKEPIVPLTEIPEE